MKFSLKKDLKRENNVKKNIGEFDDLETSPLLSGCMPKFWVNIDGQKYVFKQNYNSGENIGGRTDFGEVIYSNICQQLDVPCVESEFACYYNNGQKIDGVLIKSFLKKYEFAINYSDMVVKVRKCYDNIKYSCASEVIKISKQYAEFNNYIIETRKVKDQIVKQCILDFFLAQDDRGINNVEFVANVETLRLAPIFDNGFCLGLANDKFQNCQIIDHIKKDPYFDFNLGTKFSLYETTISNLDYLKELVDYCQNYHFARKFVKKVLDIDINRELNLLESQSGEKINSLTKKASAEIFNRKKNLYIEHFENGKSLD